MRPCPSCGAENDDVAATCATCLRALTGPPPRRAVTPPVLPPPRPPVTPAPHARRSTAVLGKPERSRAPRITRPLSADGSSSGALPLPSLRARSASGAPADPGASAPLEIPGPIAPSPAVGADHGSGAVPVPVPTSTSGSIPPPIPGRTRSASGSPTYSVPSPAANVALARPAADARPPTDDASRSSTPSSVSPPPTRTSVVTTDGTELSPPTVGPMPEAPDGGVFSPARYTIAFARARWQRGKAIRFYRDRVRQATRVLDGVLYELGTAVRVLGIDNRATAGEMRAIDELEEKRAQLGGESADLQRRQTEENARFAELEAERAAKVTDAESALAAATEEVERIEAERRVLREGRKTIERQQKAYLEAAEKREHDAGKLPTGDERTQMRRAAEDHRRETAALDTERQELERKLAALDRPHAQGTARVESIKAELVAARRSLEDAREGHRHRLSELDAEQGRKGKESHQAAGEIHQRLVTLGTIVNLNRVERPELDELYARIDAARETIGERSRLIDRLAAERDSYQRGALLRGAATLGLSVIVLLTIILVVVASL